MEVDTVFAAVQTIKFDTVMINPQFGKQTLPKEMKLTILDKGELFLEGRQKMTWILICAFGY